MPFNLIKTYNQLLEIAHLDEQQKNKSLYAIFKRDIEDNETLNFRGKKIWPIKSDQPAMQTLYSHLTCISEKVEEGDRVYKRRIFDHHRSVRLHWVLYHLLERKAEGVKVFSAEERIDGRDVKRTYIYDVDEKYIVVLEPQKTGNDYYFITAHYLYEKWGTKAMAKRLKHALPDIH
jgi:hypothetical protein